jgi:hypothetical protein
MSVEIIDNRGTWDEFVEKSPYGTLYHRWDFLKIVEKYSGYHLATYGIYKGEQLVSVLPLFSRKSKGLKVTYSPPRSALVYTPYMSFVMSEEYAGMKQHRKEALLDSVAQDVDEAVCREAPNIAVLGMPPGIHDLREFRLMGYELEMKYTYAIDLSKPLEELWNRLSKTCKQTIKNWDKKHVEVQPSADADTFFAIMRRALDREGHTFYHTQPPDYLKDMLAAFPDNIKMEAMYSEGQLVAMQVTTQYKDRLLLWMYGRAGDCGSPVEYMNWRAIKGAKEAGLKVVENWGTESKRLNPYKSKFNPSLDICCSIKKTDAFGKLAFLTYAGVTHVPGLSAVLRE